RIVEAMPLTCSTRASVRPPRPAPTMAMRGVETKGEFMARSDDCERSRVGRDRSKRSDGCRGKRWPDSREMRAACARRPGRLPFFEIDETRLLHGLRPATRAC